MAILSLMGLVYQAGQATAALESLGREVDRLRNDLSGLERYLLDATR